MNKQINLRLPEKLLNSAMRNAKEQGFATTQEFIKEVLREKLFSEREISKEELSLVKALIQVNEEKSLYRTEKELFDKLRE